jgi:hypothetical protein
VVAEATGAWQFIAVRSGGRSFAGMASSVAALLPPMPLPRPPRPGSGHCKKAGVGRGWNGGRC